MKSIHVWRAVSRVRAGRRRGFCVRAMLLRTVYRGLGFPGGPKIYLWWSSSQLSSSTQMAGALGPLPPRAIFGRKTILVETSNNTPNATRRRQPLDSVRPNSGTLHCPMTPQRFFRCRNIAPQVNSYLGWDEFEASCGDPSETLTQSYYVLPP